VFPDDVCSDDFKKFIKRFLIIMGVFVLVAIFGGKFSLIGMMLILLGIILFAVYLVLFYVYDFLKRVLLKTREVLTTRYMIVWKF